MIHGKTKSGWYRAWETSRYHVNITSNTFTLVRKVSWAWFVSLTFKHWQAFNRSDAGKTYWQFGPVIFFHNKLCPQ